jgi:hypothetical protein
MKGMRARRKEEAGDEPVLFRAKHEVLQIGNRAGNVRSSSCVVSGQRKDDDRMN